MDPVSFIGYTYSSQYVLYRVYYPAYTIYIYMYIRLETNCEYT